MASDEFWNVGWVDNFVLKPRILFRNYIIDTKISFNLSHKWYMIYQGLQLSGVMAVVSRVIRTTFQSGFGSKKNSRL